jgi:hypothetical protein
MLLLGIAFVGYWLGSAVPVRTAEVQTSTPSEVKISDLLGIWEQVETSSTDVCVTISLIFSVPGDAQEEPVRFRADQRVKCDDDREYIVHYDGQLLQNNLKYFISLNAMSNGGKLEPVESVGKLDTTGYSPDRFTLWLSRNRCVLSGSSEDSRGPNQGFDFVTLQRSGCS